MLIADAEATFDGRTLRALLHRGLIETYAWTNDATGWHYRITEGGRAALEPPVFCPDCGNALGFGIECNTCSDW